MRASIFGDGKRRAFDTLGWFMKTFIAGLLCAAVFGGAALAQEAHIRVNQAGYLPGDRKVAIAFANERLGGDFLMKDAATGAVVFRGGIEAVAAPDWGGAFSRYHLLDFSAVAAPGRCVVELERSGAVSQEFGVGAYPAFHEDLLFFMRQQRCGYNPFLDVVCHQHDGRSFYAPFPDESFVDASGGWHDAGDQLKYLITASNATARMMLAFELQPQKFGDRVDALGRDGRPNGIPDVLDEAKWGLEWIHKLHPQPDQLFHQVADDRDHRGFKMPDADNADYGWGANSYRPVYFADGKPQGLSEFQSNSTGVANIAGRSAAAMAMASRIWREGLDDAVFADRCLRAARSLYAMGQRQEGAQQGNSFGAPYRYNELTWADDMEHAAAELYKATQEAGYLDDAVRYARLAATTSWMEYDDSSMGELMSRHYAMYPFTNVGHFALHPLVNEELQAELAGYYRSGIERIVARAEGNPYGVGVPFLWCSSNLVVAFITQVHLYERMTGDTRYRAAALDHRDWLFGRNPWGTSMFEGIPEGGEFPEDTHLPTTQLLGVQVRGGLVDGPIAAETHGGLIGLRLTEADEFAAFQPRDVVYHDDVGDYATNEPTMDGTADAILVVALWSEPAAAPVATRAPAVDPRFQIVQGGIVRGDTGAKRLALVFTGHEFAEGGITIADALARHGVKATFYLTGRFYRTRANRKLIERLRDDGHELGPHSDRHLLYADWRDRSQTLVTREQFEQDLAANFAAMRPFGIDRRAVRFFMPPFEWYNAEVAGWSAAMGYRVVSFTPGTRSNADYTADDAENFVSSEAILESIRRREDEDPHGLNGFLLLSHIGSGPRRTDKFHDRIDELIGWLLDQGYELVTVDELLAS